MKEITKNEQAVFCEYCHKKIKINEENEQLYPIHNHCFYGFIMENISMIEVMAEKMRNMLERGKLDHLEDFAGRCQVSSAIIMDCCEKKMQ